MKMYLKGSTTKQLIPYLTDTAKHNQFIIKCFYSQHKIFTMANASKKNKSPLDKSLPEVVNETTKQRIDKHLKDFNDTISEDDISNINTDIQTEAEEDPTE